MNVDKMEILRMAKEIVTNEYTDLRAQLHNQWVVDSSKLWAARRIRLPYPEIPPHPTEEDILERAKKLLQFVDETSVHEESVDDVQPDPIENEVILESHEDLELSTADNTSKVNMTFSNIFKKIKEVKNNL